MFFFSSNNGMIFFIALSNVFFSLSSMEKEILDAYEFALNEHLPALSSLRRETIIDKRDLDEESQQLAKIVSAHISPSEGQLVRRVIQAFKERAGRKRRSNQTAPVETIRKLSILAGNIKNPNGCILRSFKTSTTSGHVRLAKRLVRTYQINDVLRFQELIGTFLTEENWSVVNNLETSLHDISEIERLLLSLWVTNEHGVTNPLEEYVRDRVPSFFTVDPSTRLVGLANAPSYIMAEQWFYNRLLGKIASQSTKGSKKGDSFINVAYAFLKQESSGVTTFLEKIELIKIELEKNKLAPSICKKLILFLNCKNSIKLREFKAQFLQANDQIDRVGILFKIYNHLYVMREDLLTVYHAIGKLDIVISAAKLIKKLPGKYCLPKIIDSCDATLMLDGYWHMLLDHNTAQQNSIEIHEHDPHIVLITGPNNGGKSTAIRAIGICEYLAARLGIVPARCASLSFAPHVLTSINLIDNPGSHGLFEANIKRLGLISYSSQQSPDISVLIIDEPARGGNEKTESAAIKAFVSSLSTIRNRIICLLTTHNELFFKFASSAPTICRLLYGHSDYQVNDDPRGSDDSITGLKTIKQIFPDFENFLDKG